jgi:hypothetical protein
MSESVFTGKCDLKNVNDVVLPSPLKIPTQLNHIFIDGNINSDICTTPTQTRKKKKQEIMIALIHRLESKQGDKEAYQNKRILMVILVQSEWTKTMCTNTFLMLADKRV